MIGFIQIHRQLLEWEWYLDIPVRLTFLHLLIIANWKDKEWKGTIIKRGQVIIGRKKLSKEIGISERQLRTAINKLKSTNEIAIKSTNKYSVVTIIKYEDYQNKENVATSKSTSKKSNERPASDQQATTTKEDNNIITKKENIIKENAYTFLKINSPEELQTFEMQNKKSIPDYKTFIEFFNNKVEIKEIKYKPGILMATLKNLKNSWNQNTLKQSQNEYNPSDHIKN